MIHQLEKNKIYYLEFSNFNNSFWVLLKTYRKVRGKSEYYAHILKKSDKIVETNERCRVCMEYKFNELDDLIELDSEEDFNTKILPKLL